MLDSRNQVVNIATVSNYGGQHSLDSISICGRLKSQR